jgi:hypothetical protein
MDYEKEVHRSLSGRRTWPSAAMTYRNVRLLIYSRWSELTTSSIRCNNEFWEMLDVED